MRLRATIATVAALAAASLLTAPAAPAAVEAGDECAPNFLDATFSRFNIKRDEGSPLQAGSPIDGVVTGWRVNATGYTGATSELLKAIRPTGDTYKFEIVGESHIELIEPEAVNAFATRIPVKAGDFFGAVGFPGVLVCTTSSSDDHVAYIAGNPPVGTTQTFSITSGSQASVVAVVEPDADGDGYGDETQDGCPQSAAFSGACPAAVELRVRAKVRKRSIQLRVTPSGEASVDVYGQVGWNFKPKPKGQRARASKKRLIVALDGGSKQVASGTTTLFTVSLPQPVRLRLGRLAPRESIRAKLTLRATNAAGIAKNTRLRVKLPGRRRAR